MVRRRWGLVALGLGLPLVPAALVACADDSPSAGPTAVFTAPVSGHGGPPDADPEAIARGHELARTRGCTACHGASGEGGLGPPWVDLLGTTVEFTDGSTVVADVPYISSSITEPAAQIVAGYAVTMPKTDLTAAEVADLVTYVASLSG